VNSSPELVDKPLKLTTGGLEKWLTNGWACYEQEHWEYCNIDNVQTAAAIKWQQ